MKLEVGMYVRTKEGLIAKIKDLSDNPLGKKDTYYSLDKEIIDRTTFLYRIEKSEYIDITYKEDIEQISKASHNIIDLIEYMDLLVIENKIKDIDNREIYLFNPVRCDGFTTYGDGKHCMIINLDYIIPIKNIKVYKVLTHEQFESMSYEVGE